MAPSAFHPREHFDELLDRLHQIGRPPSIHAEDWVQWGRQAGKQGCWIGAWLPGKRIGNPRWVEALGPDLDMAAKAMIVIELTADDKERAAAMDSLGAEA